MAKRRSRRRGGAGALTLVLLAVVAVGTLFTVWVFGLWPDGTSEGQLPGDELPALQPDEAPAGPPSGEDEPELGDGDTPTRGESDAPSRSDVSSREASEGGGAQTGSSSAPTVADSGTFEDFYYYEADKAMRYVNYQLANPSLPAGDVVWRVNMGLDGTPYEDYVTVDAAHTNTYIVNKHHKLPDNFVPDNLVDLAGYRATEETVAAYYAMQADARAQGYIFSAISAYRSIDSQRSLYNGYLQSDPQHVVDTYSARPGFSEHHTGRAIDLAGSSGGLLNFENTPECGWVHENAHKYGFILRYPYGYEHLTGYDYEPWHITYVGVDVATDMKNKGIVTLEEYTVKHIEHRP